MAASRRQGGELSQQDAQARRLVGLMVSFCNARRPLSSENLRAAHYPGLSQASFLRQFSRDRERLARAGLVIAGERRSREEALWHAEASSFADVDALSADDALVLDVLCSRLAADPAFAQRDELRHALAKLDGAFACPTAARLAPLGTGNSAALATLVEALELRQAAEVDYVDAQGMRTRRAYAPYGSFGLRGHTYVVCARLDAEGQAQPEELRTLRDDRMLGVRLLEASYDIPQDFNADDHRKLPFQMGPVLGVARLLDAGQATETACAELDRLGKRVPPTDVPDGSARGTDADARGPLAHGAWDVPMSDLDDTAVWAVAEGLVPMAPPQLVRTWHALLEDATRYEASELPPAPRRTRTSRRARHTTSSHSSGPQTRELVALVGALREEGTILHAPSVASRLGVTVGRARELLALLLTSGTDAGLQLPLGLADDEDELVLCFSRGVRGRPLRLTRSEAAALDAALDELGLASDDDLRRAAHAAFWPSDLTSDAAARRLAASERVASDTDAETSLRLEACSRALIEGAGLCFAYRATSGERTQRRVVPRLIRHDAGHWYLDAYDADRHAARTFRLDRMDNLRVTHAPSVPDDPAAGSHAERSVRLLFREAHALELLAWPRLEVVQEGKEGVLAEMPYYGGDWLPLRLAACCADVRTDDEALAKAVRASAERLSAAAAGLG